MTVIMFVNLKPDISSYFLRQVTAVPVSDTSLEYYIVVDAETFQICNIFCF